MLSSQATLLRTLADTLTLADLASPVKGVGGAALAQPIADALALVDTLRLARGLGLADAVVLADALSLQGAYLRTIADTLGLADSIDARLRAAAAVLNLADAVYLGETPADAVYAGSVKVWP